MYKGMRNKGFTLIELIVVLVILVIGALFGVSSLRGFAKNAEQNARNDVARTIFMAAQTALTQKYNQDRDFSLSGYKGVPLPVAAHASLTLEKERDRAQAGRIVYMVSSGADPSTELIEWLSPQMNDKAILGNSILIEYDKETGRMLSAFYSEKKLNNVPVTLGYGTGGGYNVCNRSAAALAAGFVGYYGVDDTGEVIRSEAPKADLFDVLLVDYVDHNGAAALTTHADRPYGVLTAEVLLPKDNGLRDESYVYTLALTDAEGGAETLTFSEKAGTTLPNGAAPDFTLEDLKLQASIGDAIAHPLTFHGRKIAVYCESAAVKGGDATNDRLVFVLDCVQSLDAYTPQNSLSIRHAYPNLKNGELLGSLTIDDGANSTTVFSDTDSSRPAVQVLYGGAGSDNEYEIQSVRHLSNLRYNTDENAKFYQTQNLYLQDYNLTRLNFMPIGNPYDAAITGESEYGFVGNFSNDSNLNIYDLYVDLVSDAIKTNMPGLKSAGLFDRIGIKGMVQKLRLYSAAQYTLFQTNPLWRVLPVETSSRTADVRGVTAAGGVAGFNRGTIRECTVLGKIVAKNDDDLNESIAGGIAGGNEASGKIINCFTAAEVQAGKYAGGVAGSSQGQISQCEAGTASYRDPGNSTNLYLSGVARYGARGTADPVYLPVPGTANDTFRIINDQSGGAAGGIVGAMSAGGTVEYCVNACKVESGNSDEQTGPNNAGIAGGIAGVVESSAPSTMRFCYNAGAIYGSEVAGGVVGELIKGKMSNCYNAGYINRQMERKEINGATYYLPGTAYNIGNETDHKSGGLVGYGSGEDIYITDCYSAQYAGGRYSGAFGVMNKTAVQTPGQIANCCFMQNVLNDEKKFHWETASGINELVPESENPLRMYTRKTLRKAPGESNLSSSAYNDGNAATAMFGYKYPTLKPTNESHRTPYNDVVENYGWVKLNVPEANPNTDVITVEFGVTPDKEAMLVFELTTDGVGGATKSFFVPIGKYNYSDESNFAELQALADKAVNGFVYGYKFFPPPDKRPDSTLRDYKLGVKTYKVAEASDYGYDGYRYVLSFNTKAVGLYDELLKSKIPPHMSGNLVNLKVWLYNAEKGFNNSDNADKVAYDEWTIAGSDRIWLNPDGYRKDNGVYVSAQELCYKLGTESSNQIDIKFEFSATGPSPEISVKRNKDIFDPLPPKNLKDAIEQFETNKVWLALKHDSTIRYPYYVTNGELHIVLYYYEGENVKHASDNGLEAGNLYISVKTNTTLRRWFPTLG